MAKQKKQEKIPVSRNSLLPTFKELRNSAFASIKKALDLDKNNELDEKERSKVFAVVNSLFSKLLVLTEKQVLGSKERRPKGALKRVGEMWMFSYNPQERSTPHDSFPCVIILEMYRDGFLGINLHYLPEKLRETLFRQLYSLRTSDNLLDENTRFKVRYEFISKTLRFRYARPCIKRYKYSNIDSLMIKIPAEEWAVAMYLPVYNFIGKTRRQIWMDSRRQIMRRQKNIGDID